MGRKHKANEDMADGTGPGAVVAKKSKPSAKRKKHHSESDDSDVEMNKGPDGVELEFELPPKEIMAKILDNIEAQLPREDHVKYDSRAKKLDWEKIMVFHPRSNSQIQNHGGIDPRCKNLDLTTLD